MCNLCIVIPIYNSSEVLPQLHLELLKEIEMGGLVGKTVTVVYVNDCSIDNSGDIIEEYANTDSRFVAINLRINSGQHNAIMAGLSLVQADIYVTMDDDLQHRPDEINQLIKKINKNIDVVYGDFGERHHALWKRLGSSFNNLVATLLLKKPKNLYLSPFRAVKGEVVKELLYFKGSNVYLDGLILRTTRKISTAVVSHDERFAGKSNYSLAKSIRLCMQLVFSFSILPLRIAAAFGFCVALLGFSLALLLIIQKLTIDKMPDGWSSIIVTVLFMGGVQMLCFGVLGEYIGKLVNYSNQKPQYVIERIVRVKK